MNVLIRFGAAIAVAVGVGTASAQQTITAPLGQQQVELAIDSGVITSNAGTGEVVLFETEVREPGSSWIRLEFGDVLLAGGIDAPDASWIEVISMEDAATQRLDARSLAQWRDTSAYFNGDSVLVRLVAGGAAGDNRVTVTGAQAGIPGADAESICGPTDDRLPSDDPRAARIVPIGCTAWLINDCNQCFLTAGHCTGGGFEVVEFNVPLSDPDGSINHPGPEDQYPVDLSSLQGNGGQGIGNDWAYFGCFPNSNTGLTAGEAQGDTFTVVAPPAVDGQPIRITGYGSTGSQVPGEWYAIQKTHVGPFVSANGTAISYQTDTTGGNSGSPVLLDGTNMAIGIHTHAGCGSETGNNGTASTLAALQAALADPQGVCRCPGLVLEFAAPSIVDPSGGTTMTVQIAEDEGVEHLAGSGLLHWNAGSGFQVTAMTPAGEDLYTATFPAIACGSEIDFYVSVQTVDGEVFTAPRLAPEETAMVVAADELATYAAIDFESDLGWTVASEQILTGPWERGVPAGGGLRGDPATDQDGSGQCWTTGLGQNVDLDGGPTTLTTAPFDLAGATDPILSYARWFTNDDQDEDRLRVEISNDGGASWQLLEEVAGGPNGWTIARFRVADVVAPTSDMRLRFIAADQPNNSVTEAAIDRLRFEEYLCDASCVEDFDGDGAVTLIDLNIVLQFFGESVEPGTNGDASGDGFVDVEDVNAVLVRFDEAC